MKSRSVLVRVFIVCAVLFAVALIASPVIGASDNPLTIKTMKLSVWPEYDDPRVLVIYQGEFADGSAFPQPVMFPVPLGSEINQVCAIKQPGDEHLCQLYDTKSNQDNLEISYTLPIPTYFLEYYWDGIKGQPDKSFIYKYVSPYAIDRLEVDVQQPLKATDFKLGQTYASVTSDSTGMKYYHYVFNDVKQGQVISLDASYTKPDNKPSVAKKETSGVGTGGGSLYTVIGIAAAALAVFVIGFVAFKRKPVPAVVRAGQSRRAARAQAMRRASESQRAPAQAVPKPSRPESARPPSVKPETVSRQVGVGGAMFCPKCGERLEVGDNFCPGCGDKARKRS